MGISHILLLLLGLTALATASNSLKKSSSSSDEDTDLTVTTGTFQLRKAQVNPSETHVNTTKYGGDESEDSSSDEEEAKKRDWVVEDVKSKKGLTTSGFGNKKALTPKKGSGIRNYLPGKKTAIGVAVAGTVITAAYFCCGTPDGTFFTTCGDAFKSCFGYVCQLGLNRIVDSCPKL